MLTEKAQALIDLARDHAYACGATELTLNFLLAAMASQVESRLHCASCLDWTAEQLQAACPRIPEAIPAPGQMPMAESVRAFLEEAEKLAREIPDPTHPGSVDVRHLAGAAALFPQACALLKTSPVNRALLLERLAATFATSNQGPDLTVLTERLRLLRSGLLENIFGQDQAVNAFVEALFNAELVAAADTQRKAPQAIFVFAGPPGVGKTYLAELGATHLGRPFKRFDMSAYAENLASLDLTGNSRRYHGSRPGLLTDFVDQHPKAVLLFDEVEKAHLNVIHCFLQILDAGVLEDKYRERNVAFRDTVIIFTTNAGRLLYDRPNTSGIHSANASFHRKTILEALQTETNPQTHQPFFPAAICSRLATGYPVMFNHLGINELERVVHSELHRFRRLFERQYLKQMAFDERLALCLVLKESGRADARSLRAQAGAFCKTEIFKFCQLLKAQRLGEVLQKVDQVQWLVDGEPADLHPDVQGIFETSQPPRILIVAESELTDLYREHIVTVNWRIAHSEAEALRILAEEDVDFVLLDLLMGRGSNLESMTLRNFDRLPAAARSLEPGQELLRKMRERLPDLPVFLLAFDEATAHPSPHSPMDEHMFSACVEAGGARGIVPTLFIDGMVKGWKSHRDQLAMRLSALARQLHREAESRRLGQQHKVLTFETAPQIDLEQRSVTVRLRNLRLVQTVAALDVGEVLAEAERPKVGFNDVIGAVKAKEELRFFVDFLKYPKRYAALGLKAPKGVLLHGPPGTGKTLLARAMAGECGITFFATAASRFVTALQGSGPENVRALFERARRYAPSIVFIDEIDALVKGRTSELGGHGEDMALNELLTQMDGFEASAKYRPVFVLAATNFTVASEGEGASDRPDRSLDPALVRRFARVVLVDLPDTAARRQYVEWQIRGLRGAQISPTTIEQLANQSEGLSISHLEEMMELAKRKALSLQQPLQDSLLLGALDATRGRTEMMDRVERPKVRWDDVLGAASAKEELRFCLDYLKDPERFTALGLKGPRGILLYGPPGTGKTLLARAAAGEAGVPFLAATPADFQSKWHGESERRLRDFFARARRYAPALVFVDEIDAIGVERTGRDPVNDRILNALLTELDGFAEPSSDRAVFLLAATNASVDDTNPDGGRMLDPALLRRFSRRILVGLPDTATRKEFLHRKFSRIPRAQVGEETVNLLAARTWGVSLAELDHILELAKRMALRADQPLGEALLMEALNTSRFGEIKNWSPELLRRNACHEAGHTLLYCLSGWWPLEVTIVARGRQGGFMARDPVEVTRENRTRAELQACLRTMLGGRAAEILCYGPETGPSTGAAGDLQAATVMARRMVVDWGMDDDFGLAALPGLAGDSRLIDGPLQQSLQASVNRLLRAEMDNAMAALREHQSSLQALAEALLRDNTLYRKELAALLPVAPNENPHAKAESTKGSVRKP